MEIRTDCYCAKCGAAMCTNVDTSYKSNYVRVDIVPCQNCLDEASQDGYEKGMNDGLSH